MHRKQNIEIPPKITLFILCFICIVFIVVTTIFSSSSSVLNSIFGAVVVPMEKGINSIGTSVQTQITNMKDAKNLRAENEKLTEKVADLEAELNSVESDQQELENLRKLYALDQKYESYPTVGARIIAADSSNWYNTFTIDKGSEDGIEVDMNVIADEGLVGIVYSVGKNYSKVRSIIDDTSYVSGMFANSANNCIVNGDLNSIEDGYITVDHIVRDAKVNDGDEIVTSNVSSKFLPGITIGYVSDVTVDNNSLTKSGKVTPVVDFKHLQTVLVITKLKVTGEEED